MTSILDSGFLSATMSAITSAVTSYTCVKDPGERTITLEELSWHDSPQDCWIVIYDRVYDISTFFDEHPGGSDILMEYAGRDASGAFRGSGHSPQALRALARFLIGELPMHERIFRKPGGYRLSDIPE